MQYFSIIARKGGDAPRTCAMLQDSTIDAAAKKARLLVRSDHLPHVERHSTFSIRKSSRRETSLLQSYLAVGTGDKMSTYLQEDLDSLLARRNTLLLSFFMALYLDPVGLKRRFDTSAPGRKTDSGSTGSGGITMDPETAAKASEADHSNSLDAVDAHAEIAESATSAEVGDTVSDDSQISALADIVNGGDQHGDDELDLF